MLLLWNAALFLPACNRARGPASEDVFIECDLGEFYFFDGTGAQNGELCLQSTENAYGDLAIDVYHYRRSWNFYIEVDVAEVCTSTVRDPSSLCTSDAQFWSTGDGWSYAVCRTEAYGMTFWRMEDLGAQYELMEELDFSLVCG